VKYEVVTEARNKTDKEQLSAHSQEFSCLQPFPDPTYTSRNSSVTYLYFPLSPPIHIHHDHGHHLPKVKQLGHETDHFHLVLMYKVYLHTLYMPSHHGA
jgi:hypothetical protein